MAAVLALGMTAACGDKEMTEPTVDRTAVAGVYDLATLTFDPHGSLPKTDILARLAPPDQPELVIARADDTFQLFFRDPSDGTMNLAEGKYTLLDGQIRLNFRSAKEAERLLLPQRVEFDFNETAMTLSYQINTHVPLARLRELVPEYRTEQLPDPVAGQLAVIFTLDRY
jgi:hypothetical protein